MKMKEIKEMSDAELVKATSDMQEESLKLKIQGRTGDLKTPARLGIIRKDIARIKTEQTARAAKA